MDSARARCPRLQTLARLFLVLPLCFGLALPAFAQTPGQTPAPSPASAPPAELPPESQTQQSPEPPAYPPPQEAQEADQSSSLTLPAGTNITVRVTDPLSSDHNQPGDAFSATLQQPLVVDGIVVARRGQMVLGQVTAAQKAGRAKGVSSLAITLTELTVADGQQVPIQSQFLRRLGPTSVGRDAAAVGTTTALGAAIGAAADWGRGAAIGAGAGAAAGIVGVLLTRGQPTVVYPETPLTFRLTAPVTISTERGWQAFRPVTQEDYEAARPRTARAYPGPIYPRRYYYGYPPPPYYYGYDYYPGPYFYGPRFYFYGGHHRGWWH